MPKIKQKKDIYTQTKLCNKVKITVLIMSQQSWDKLYKHLNYHKICFVLEINIKTKMTQSIKNKVKNNYELEWAKIS